MPAWSPGVITGCGGGPSFAWQSSTAASDLGIAYVRVTAPPSTSSTLRHASVAPRSSMKTRRSVAPGNSGPSSGYVACEPSASVTRTAAAAAGTVPERTYSSPAPPPPPDEARQNASHDGSAHGPWGPPPPPPPPTSTSVIQHGPPGASQAANDAVPSCARPSVATTRGSLPAAGWIAASRACRRVSSVAVCSDEQDAVVVSPPPRENVRHVLDAAGPDGGRSVSPTQSGAGSSAATIAGAGRSGAIGASRGPETAAPPPQPARTTTATSHPTRRMAGACRRLNVSATFL